MKEERWIQCNFRQQSEGELTKYCIAGYIGSELDNNDYHDGMQKLWEFNKRNKFYNEGDILGKMAIINDNASSFQEAQTNIIEFLKLLVRK